MNSNQAPLVRLAIAADYAQIAEIYNESIRKGGITFDETLFSADDIANWVTQYHNRERLLVIEQAEQVLGWGCIKRYSDRPGYRICCETSIYLAQQAIGKGYGSQLQAEILKQAANLNYHHVVAKIVAANQGSIRFHERFGYELVGIQKEIGVSQSKFYDIALLQLILPDHSVIR